MKHIVITFLLLIPVLNLNAQSGHSDGIMALAMNKDGKLVSSSRDGSLLLWDENAKKLMTYVRPADQYTETSMLVTRLTFLNDTNVFMASSLMEGYLGSFDNSVLKSLKTGYMISEYGLALTSDNRYFLVANNNYSGLTVYTFNGQKYNTIPFIVEDVFPFPSDQEKFITLSSATGLNIFDVNAERQMSLLSLTQKGRVVISPKEDCFFYKNVMYSVKGEKVITLPDSTEIICFSPDGNTIYSSASDKINIWTKEGKLKFSFEYKNIITALILTPDGNAMVVGDIKGNIEMLTLLGQAVMQYR